MHLIVRTGHSEEVLELVLREQVQIGLVRDLPHPAVTSVPLYEDEIVLVVHPGTASPSRRRSSSTSSARSG